MVKGTVVTTTWSTTDHRRNWNGKCVTRRSGGSTHRASWVHLGGWRQSGDRIGPAYMFLLGSMGVVFGFLGWGQIGHFKPKEPLMVLSKVNKVSSGGRGDLITRNDGGVTSGTYTCLWLCGLLPEHVLWPERLGAV